MNIDASLLGIAIFIVMLFVSIALHETMHAVVAYKLGDDLAHSQGRISLNPLDHIDPVLTIILPAGILILNQYFGMGLPLLLAAKPVPINRNRISGDELGLAAVGVAGPLTNLALATVGALFMRTLLVDSSTLKDIVELFVHLNVGLFVFNMMPFPPLDGSRLLYAVSPAPLQRLMEQIEALGMMSFMILLVIILPLAGPALDSANTFILNLLLG